MKPDLALLIPLVVDVDPVFQLRAGFGGACWAGWFKVDRVQALLSETGVLRQRGQQLLHHSTGTASWLSAKG